MTLLAIPGLAVWDGIIDLFNTIMTPLYWAVSALLVGSAARGIARRNGVVPGRPRDAVLRSELVAAGPEAAGSTRRCPVVVRDSP